MRKRLRWTDWNRRRSVPQRVAFWMALAVILAACADDASPTTTTTPGTTTTPDTPTTAASDTTTTGPPSSGGVLVYGMWEDPDSLDATFSFTGGSNKVYGSMCETLFDLDEDNQISPRLAAAMPEVSEDGTVLTIPLRQDAQFNDGTPFNAEAVKISLDRHKTAEGSNRVGDLAPLEEVVVVDEYTVELRLNAAAPGPITGALVMQAGVILSPAQLEALGDNFSDFPVCVGPFQFVEQVPGDRVVLEKSELYYDADSVHLDGVIFRIIPDDAVRTANLRSGDIHAADTVLASDLPLLEGDPTMTVHPAPWLGFDALYINMSNADGRDQPSGPVDNPLNRDPRIREALELSLDREAISQVLYSGYVIPGCTPFSPAHPFHMPDLQANCPERDLDRARELLAEAGEPNPEIELLVRQTPEFIQLGELLQSMIEESGFTVNIEPRDVTAAVNSYFEGTYQIFQNGWTGRIDPDGSFFVWAVHHPDHVSPFFGMGEPTDPLDIEITEMVLRSRGIADFDERYDVYHEMVDRMINERRNVIYLFHRVNYSVIREEVNGFTMSSDLRPGFIGVTLSN